VLWVSSGWLSEARISPRLIPTPCCGLRIPFRALLTRPSRLMRRVVLLLGPLLAPGICPVSTGGRAIEEFCLAYKGIRGFSTDSRIVRRPPAWNAQSSGGGNTQPEQPASSVGPAIVLVGTGVFVVACFLPDRRSCWDGATVATPDP
jgi:hypothetical protein